jgi:hypothetical protein
MYYTKIEIMEGEQQESLVYYCNYCNNQDTTFTEDNIVISKRFINKKDQNYQMKINEYSKYDSTLPHINHILCPNKDCDTNHTDNESVNKRNIIYYRYDDINMKYAYYCTICETTWKSGDT